jgi:hypothetical protein
MATKGTETLDAATLQAMHGPGLTAEQAALISQQGQEAVVFALLALAKQLAEKQALASTADPSARSGQTPPYIKAAFFWALKQRGHNPVSAVLDGVRDGLKNRSVTAAAHADF